ncbi:unnamed protein product [Rhizophagus irregularis]|nr:unnamed protein product [Rhizophagus irregularis]
MSSEYLYVKTVEYLTSVKTEHLMAGSVIYQGLDENPWISKDELRGVVEKAVNLIKNSHGIDFERSGKLIQIIPQFDIAFDCISNLQDVGVIKTNKEKPLTSEQIKHNINKLKGKLAAGTSKLCQELVVILNGLTISELTWKIPLASQVISDDSLLVAQLSKKQKKKFMKPVEEMVPPTIPQGVTEECVKFVTNFMPRSIPRLQEGLTHDGNWKECGNKLNEVTLKILDTLKSVWCNPAFGPEFVETMNEGTYVNNVVVSAIRATLFDNPFGEHAFITTFERQSIASSDRRGDGRTGRRPDIMLVSKESDKLYELITPLRRSSRILEDSSTVTSD